MELDALAGAVKLVGYGLAAIGPGIGGSGPASPSKSSRPLMPRPASGGAVKGGARQVGGLAGGRWAVVSVIHRLSGVGRGHGSRQHTAIPPDSAASSALAGVTNLTVRWACAYNPVS